MILSSADILRILGGNQIIRLAAKVQLVESKPALSGREGLFIYIKRYPELAEFEATFTLWIESDGSEPDDIIIAELKKLLPKVQVTPGLMTEVKTTEFRSESTLEAPAAAPAPQVDMSALEERFEALAEDIQDQMLLVTSGRNGKDGRDGADGKDGRDLVATEADLEDLQNVEQQGPKEKGQVLTWDGTSWVNLYVPQVYSTISAGGNGGGATELNGLSDVTIDPALLDRDQGLVYDGTEWVVGTPPVIIEVHNQTGVTIPKGTPVYVAGTHSSGKALIAPADANGAGTYPAFGLTHEDVLDGVDGHVMLSGLLTNVDTNLFQGGDALYLSTTPGVLTNARPTGTNEKVQKVGLVTRVHQTSGSILIIGAGRTNDINNELVTLIGMNDKDATSMGTFTGNIISDNVSVKVALQELETAVEAGVPEAPQDGNYYVRQNGAWVELSVAIGDLTIDGGIITP